MKTKLGLVFNKRPSAWIKLGEKRKTPAIASNFKNVLRVLFIICLIVLIDCAEQNDNLIGQIATKRAQRVNHRFAGDAPPAGWEKDLNRAFAGRQPQRPTMESPFQLKQCFTTGVLPRAARVAFASNPLRAKSPAKRPVTSVFWRFIISVSWLITTVPTLILKSLLKE
jgi:hypothetical protein